VSSAGAVRIIRQAKERGVKVTAETAPQYLLLTDEALRGFETSYKVNPPLRSAEDVAAVRAGLRDGTIDVVFARPPFDLAHVDVALLYRERIVAVLSEDHPLAAAPSIRIRDIAGETLLLWDRHMMPVLHDRILNAYASAGVRPKTLPTPEVGPHNHAGLMLVASGKGIYLCIGVPLTSPQPAGGIAVVPVSDPEATIDVCIAWRKGETSQKILRFLDCVWKTFPQPTVEATAPTASRRAS